MLVLNFPMVIYLLKTILANTMVICSIPFTLYNYIISTVILKGFSIKFSMNFTMAGEKLDERMQDFQVTEK